MFHIKNADKTAGAVRPAIFIIFKRKGDLDERTVRK